MAKKFQRRIEDFVCEKCGTSVYGDGFTNHCPECLTSKHVDINPGDRAAACGGLMQAVRLEGSSPEYAILHRCDVCGVERRNKVKSSDSEVALLKLAGR